MKKLLQFKSIRTKLMFSFSLVLLLVIILGIYNFIAVNKTNNDTEWIVDEQLPILVAGEHLTIDTVQSLASVRGYILYGTSNFKEEFNQYMENIKRNQEDILKMNDSEEVKQLFIQMNKWRDIIINDVFTPYEQGNEEVVLETLTDIVVPMSEEILGTLDKITLEREKLINKRGKNIISSGKSTINIVVAVSILVIILGLFVAVITSKSISNPIEALMERMRLITDGDLSSKPLEIRSKDEVGQLVKSTNEMNNNIKSLLSQINKVSETVNGQSEELTQAANEVMAGSEQVAATMQELASGAESQANHASELSNVMELFSSTIEDANDNGRNIQESSNDVLNMTKEGYQLMEKSTDQMNTINEIVRNAVENVQSLDTQSQKISELVIVIEDIAEQTNLLALNAAIEAARAGEHGLGFAVVADEVRKLAEGVAVSITDITDIVNNIQQKSSHVTESLQSGYKEVEQGTSQIIETGETFKEISTAVEEMVNNIQVVTDNLSEMSGEGQEMNSSIREVAAISEEAAAGIEQTSASSQQTSSAMEEVASSSKDLAHLSEKLNGLVQQFKL